MIAINESWTNFLTKRLSISENTDFFSIFCAQKINVLIVISVHVTRSRCVLPKKNIYIQTNAASSSNFNEQSTQYIRSFVFDLTNVHLFKRSFC